MGGGVKRRPRPAGRCPCLSSLGIRGLYPKGGALPGLGAYQGQQPWEAAGVDAKPPIWQTMKLRPRVTGPQGVPGLSLRAQTWGLAHPMLAGRSEGPLRP